MIDAKKQINTITLNSLFLGLNYLMAILSYNYALGEFRSGEHSFVYAVLLLPAILACATFFTFQMIKSPIMELKSKSLSSLSVNDESEIKAYLNNVSIATKSPVIMSVVTAGFSILTIPAIYSDISHSASLVIIAALSSVFALIVSILILKIQLSELKM